MNSIATGTVERIRPEIDKYKHLLAWETYRRYRNGILPNGILFLLQAPALAQVIADIAKEQETNHEATAENA